MEFYTFSHDRGEEILKTKGLLREINDVFEMMKLEDVKHELIQSFFQNKGWEKEKYVLNEKNWRWDLYRDKVAMSIEFTGGIENINRDLLRALLLKHINRIDVLVFITTTHINNPVYENVKDQIKFFAPILNLPICLLGLKNQWWQSD